MSAKNVIQPNCSDQFSSSNWFWSRVIVPHPYAGVSTVLHEILALMYSKKTDMYLTNIFNNLSNFVTSKTNNRDQVTLFSAFQHYEISPRSLVKVTEIIYLEQHKCYHSHTVRKSDRYLISRTHRLATIHMWQTDDRQTQHC